MQPHIRSGLLALGFVACGASGQTAEAAGNAATVAAPPSTTPLLYSDALAPELLPGGTARTDFHHAAHKHSGDYAIALDLDRRLGVSLSAPTGLDATAHDTLSVWVQGDATQVRIAALSNSVVASGVVLGDYLSGSEGDWQEAKIPLADLGVRGSRFDGFWLENTSGDDVPPLYLDDVTLTAEGAAIPPAIAASPTAAPEAGHIAVDPEADRHPISPLIYGANFGKNKDAARVGYTSRRWGGNHTSRYAWDVDVANRAVDWFFLNIPEDNKHPELLPDNSAADRFIDKTLAYGGEPLMTVPMLGWVPKDRETRWSYSIAKYGSQASECGSQGAGCRPDAGNGKRSDGSFITGNDPNDTSRPVGPEYVTAWMQHIAGRVGTAANGGPRFFALDNEWTLWPETHPDVHPANVTYDELWQKTVDYGSAMKAQDPAVQLFAPMAWGYCAYFGIQGECAGGPEREAHGNFIPWYLDQVCNYEKETGLRLVDYLDVHYYPQNGTYTGDESPDMQALRLRSVASLYDPNYVDESWIAAPVKLIPRMHRWIDKHCPGTKLAISEYNFGGDNTLSGALAQTEAMAIFGRERVDLATRWVAPATGGKTEDAFGIFRNYDGQGSRIDGDSVRAQSFDAAAVGSYAIRDGARLYVLLINKTTTEQTTQVDVAGGANGDVALYGFDAGPLRPLGAVKATGAGFAATLPPRSATLAVLTL